MVELTVVIPAKNEAPSLKSLLPKIRAAVPGAEIIVVDDGSTDDTQSVCTAESVRIVEHKYSKGNGAAIKSGARSATTEYVLFMDGDGQHDPAHITGLLAKLEEGYDMVVGARSREHHASTGRRIANGFYNVFGSWIVSQPVKDMTSGLRIVRRRKFLEFLHLLPNGFSYPTTITMAFYRAGYSVAYIATEVRQRLGRSHLQPWRDGIKFLLIIFKIGTLYSPLKVFLPFSVAFFVAGLGNYVVTYATSDRFTNMSAVLLTSSVLVFLMGLVSEQITMLLYKDSGQLPE